MPSSAGPLPEFDVTTAVRVIGAPGTGEGYWAGAPSAVLSDGLVYLAYRLRRPVGEGRGYANVVARSADGVHFETLAVVQRDDLGCASLERPALVRRPDGGWRLYVSLSTPDSKHWWVDALDADRSEDLPAGRRSTVWPGDGSTAVKDPVVLIGADGRWHAWVCCHPLDEPGAEDRMSTRYAHSDDGLHWSWGEVVLAPSPEGWDSRGRRVAAIVARPDGTVSGYYDGRADAGENWYERTAPLTGTAVDARLVPSGTPMGSPYGRHTLRYASVLDLGEGRGRVYYEAATPDGSNEIRTQLITVSTGG